MRNKIVKVLCGGFSHDFATMYLAERLRCDHRPDEQQKSREEFLVSGN